ncbi:hypothetical protein HDU86_002259 [Geranomyces michiganensis]|nr:hypothetical protein HDU86_002259 [Geranomyces michiganensis]
MAALSDEPGSMPVLSSIPTASASPLSPMQSPTRSPTPSSSSPSSSSRLPVSSMRRSLNSASAPRGLPFLRDSGTEDGHFDPAVGSPTKVEVTESAPHEEDTYRQQLLRGNQEANESAADKDSLAQSTNDLSKRTDDTGAPAILSTHGSGLTDDSESTSHHNDKESVPSAAAPNPPPSSPLPDAGATSLLPVPKRGRVRPRPAGTADMVVTSDDPIPTPPESPTFSRDGAIAAAASAAAPSASSSSPQKLRSELRESTLAAQQYRSQIDALQAALEEKDSRIAALTNTIDKLKEDNTGAEEYIAGLESQVERHAEIARTVERLEAELATERGAEGSSRQRETAAIDGDADPHVRKTKLAISKLWAQLMEQETKAAELDYVSEEDRGAAARAIRDQIDDLQKQLPEGTSPPPFTPHVVPVNEVLALQQTVQQLETALTKKNTEHQALAEAYDALHAEVEHYSEEVRILRDGLVDHHDRSSDKDTRLATLADANAELSSLVSGLETRIADLAEANATLATENEALSAKHVKELEARAVENAALLREIGEVKEAHAMAVKEKETLVAQHEEHLRTHSDAVRDLTSSRDAHAAERETLAARIAEMEEDHARLAAERTALAAQHDEHLRAHNDTIRVLTESRDAHAEEREALAKRVSDLKAACDAVQAEKDELSVARDSSIAEKEALAAQFAAMEVKHAALIAEKDAITAEHEGVKARIAVYEDSARELISARETHAAEKDALAAKLAEVEAAHAALIAEKNALLADNLELKDAVSKHEQSTRELASTQDAHAREVEAAQLQLAELEQQHAALLAEKAALVSEKDTLASEHAAHMQSHDNAVRDLAAQVDTHVAEREALTLKLSDLARDHVTAAAEKASIEAELAALKTQHEAVRKVDDKDLGARQVEREALEKQLATMREQLALRDAELAKLSEQEIKLNAEKSNVSAQHQEALRELRAQVETQQADRKREEEAHEAVVANHALKLAEVEGELQAFRATVVPELERRVAEATEERDTVRNGLHARASEIETHTAELRVLREQLEQANGANAVLEAALVSLKNDHATAQAAWAEGNLKLRADLEAAIAEAARLQDTHAAHVADLEEQHLAARRAHEMSESGARDLAALHTDLAAQLIAQAETEATLRAELAAAHQRVTEVEVVTRDFEAQSKKRITELESQCQALRAENQERQDAIDALTSEKSARAVESSDQEADGVVKVSLLTAELELLREVARTRDGELAALHADLEQAHLRVQELKVEVDRVRELETLHETTNARMTELSSHHQIAQTKISELEAALAAAQAQKPVATAETSTENGDVVDMYRAQISEVCSDRNAIQAEIEHLKGVMATMATAEQVKEFEKTGAEKAALETEMASLKSTLEELNGKVASLSQSESNLAAELQAARNDAAAKHQETEARLLAKVQHLEAVALDLREQLALAAEARMRATPQPQRASPWLREQPKASSSTTTTMQDEHDFEEELSVRSRKRSMDSLDSAAGRRPFSFVESIRARTPGNNNGLGVNEKPASRSPSSIIHSARAIADASINKGAADTASLAERERQELLHMIELLSAHISTADRQLSEDHGRVDRLQRELEAARAEVGTASQQSEQRAIKLQERVDKQLDEIANMEYELVKARSNENAAMLRIQELEERMKLKESETANVNNKGARSGRSRRGEAGFTPLELKEVMPALLFEEYSSRRGSSNEKRSSKAGLTEAPDRSASMGNSLPSRRTSSRPPRQSVTPTDSDIDRWRQQSAYRTIDNQHGPTSTLHVTNGSTSTLSPIDETAATAAPTTGADGAHTAEQQQHAVIGELGMELSASRRRVRDLENTLGDLERQQADLKSSARVLMERIRILENERGRSSGEGGASGTSTTPPPPPPPRDDSTPPLPPQAVFKPDARLPQNDAEQQSGGERRSRGLFSRSRNSARSKSRDPTASLQPQPRPNQQESQELRHQQHFPPRDGPIFPPPPASPPPTLWRNLSDLDLPNSAQEHQQQQPGQPRQSMSETALSRSKSSRADGDRAGSSNGSSASAMKKKKSFWWSRKSTQ